MGAEGDAALEAILGGKYTIEDYHASEADRPTIPHDGYTARSDSIPSFDLASFCSSTRRQQLLEELRKGVSEWGFFELTGHGVEEKLVDEFATWGRKVFGMPLEEKLKAIVGSTAGSPAGYLCGLKNDKRTWMESLHSWADPADFSRAVDKLWPEGDDAAKFKEIHYKYSVAMEELAVEIFSLLEEALGVKKTGFSESWERLTRTFVRFNYYPPCEQPELVNGASPHTDPGLITILRQDEIGGLQILKDDEWIVCKPRPGAFVVNIGDSLQVISNDILPSIQHRVCLNKYTPRMSIATFMLSKPDSKIQPSEELIDEGCPAQFKAFKFEELTNASKERMYKGKQVLALFRMDE